MNEFVTYKESECYKLGWRRRLSCFKKGVFLRQEEHVLVWRRAFSCIELGLFYKLRRDYWWNNFTISTNLLSVRSFFLIAFVGDSRWFPIVVRGIPSYRIKFPQRSIQAQAITDFTSDFSSNALCSLYAEGLLWARNCAPKSSVNSVRSVREKTPQRERNAYSHLVSAGL